MAFPWHQWKDQENARSSWTGDASMFCYSWDLLEVYKCVFFQLFTGGVDPPINDYTVILYRYSESLGQKRHIVVSASLLCISFSRVQSSFPPVLCRWHVSLTQSSTAPVGVVCGEAFGGRRHTSKAALAPALIYGSPSLTCLKRMYLHSSEGCKQSCGESQSFVWL